MGIYAIPITITCMLQGTLCDTGMGFPTLFMGETFAVYPTVFCACKKIGDISDTHLERDISVSSLYPMQPPR